MLNDTDETISYYENLLLTIKTSGPKDLVNIFFFIYFIIYIFDLTINTLIVA